MGGMQLPNTSLPAPSRAFKKYFEMYKQRQNQLLLPRETLLSPWRTVVKGSQFGGGGGWVGWSGPGSACTVRPGCLHTDHTCR